MRTLLHVIAALVILCAVCAMPLHAANRVVVESRSVAARSPIPFVVGVYLENDVSLRSFGIPLAIRAVGNAYPGMVGGQYNPEGRQTGLGFCINVLNTYDEEDGTCNGAGSSFKTIDQSMSEGPLYDLFYVSTPDNPDAVYFFRGNIFCGEFRPGTDFPIGVGEPSMLLHFSAPTEVGTFEVDTTCTYPSNQLLFSSYTRDQFTPDFTKGVITATPCDCPHQGDMNAGGWIDAVDFNMLADVLFFNGIVEYDPSCPFHRGDFSGDGVVDALDLNLMIDYMFFNGPGPCDPCNPVGPACAQ